MICLLDEVRILQGEPPLYTSSNFLYLNHKIFMLLTKKKSSKKGCQGHLCPPPLTSGHAIVTAVYHIAFLIMSSMDYSCLSSYL